MRKLLSLIAVSCLLVSGATNARELSKVERVNLGMAFVQVTVCPETSPKRNNLKVFLKGRVEALYGVNDFYELPNDIKNKAAQMYSVISRSPDAVAVVCTDVALEQSLIDIAGI